MDKANAWVTIVAGGLVHVNIEGEAKMRMSVAFQLYELVPETTRSSLRKRLRALLWIASTYSGEIGERAYTIAVDAMVRRKILSQDEIDRIRGEVSAEMEREKLLSLTSP